MAVPTGKKSKSKKRMRRANHDRITLPHITDCPNCAADMLAHRACPECGYYRDRQVFVPVEDEFEGEETEEEAASA